MVVMTVRPQHHELLRDEERRRAVADPLAHLGQRHADRGAPVFDAPANHRGTVPPRWTFVSRGRRGVVRSRAARRAAKRAPTDRAARSAAASNASLRRLVSSSSLVPASVMVTSTSRRSERSGAFVTKPASMSAFTLRVTPGADSRSATARSDSEIGPSRLTDARVASLVGVSAPSASASWRSSRRGRHHESDGPRRRSDPTALVLVVTDDRSTRRAETTAALVMSVLLLRSCALADHDDETPGVPWPVWLGQPVHGSTFAGAVGASNW